MTKREAVWSCWGFGLGAIAYVVIVYGFGITAHFADGRLGVLMLAGAGLAYLASKIVRIGRHDRPAH